jgi:hypothetical protein
MNTMENIFKNPIVYKCYSHTEVPYYNTYHVEDISQKDVFNINYWYIAFDCCPDLHFCFTKLHYLDMFASRYHFDHSPSFWKHEYRTNPLVHEDYVRQLVYNAYLRRNDRNVKL